jgi:hypothetical protein
MVFHDFVSVGFHSYMLLRAALCAPSENRTMALWFGYFLLGISLSAILLKRGELIPASKGRAFYYRLAIFSPVVASYFQMGFLLPALDPTLVDMELYAIDEALFGTTPALWFQQFNTTALVEWIAFFYYSYFYLMAVMLVPTLFFDKHSRVRELMVGAIMVATVGHILYTLVPGAGPYAAIEFDAPINGGFFWGLVVKTVSSAGAQLDIFPSLHTAYPTLYALHAFGNRKAKPFKYVWPIIAFFAFNMVIATMFLRWHWAIDVIAGLCVAVFARTTAVYIGKREASYGLGTSTRQPVWDRLFRDGGDSAAS